MIKNFAMNFLNYYTPKLQQSLYNGKNTNTLPILNVEIKLDHGGIDTLVWRKATNTGLLLNFNAIYLKR